MWNICYTRHILLNFYTFRTILTHFVEYYYGNPAEVTYMRYMSLQRHICHSSEWHMRYMRWHIWVIYGPNIWYIYIYIRIYHLYIIWVCMMVVEIRLPQSMRTTTNIAACNVYQISFLMIGSHFNCHVHITGEMSRRHWTLIHYAMVRSAVRCYATTLYMC